MTATLPLAPTRPGMPVDVRDLLDAVGHGVATAFESGSETWRLAVPVLGELLPEDMRQASPVAAVRAVGRELRARAMDVEEAVAAGDAASVDSAASSLEATLQGLAALVPGVVVGVRA